MRRSQRAGSRARSRLKICALRHYPQATHSVLDRAGHYLPYEQPDLLRALAQDWVCVAADAEQVMPTVRPALPGDLDGVGDVRCSSG